MTDDPRARLADGQRLLDQAEPEAALPIDDADHQSDPEVRGAALIGKGTAQYRIDDEAGALVNWQHAAELDGPLACNAWRSAAEQHVRNGDLEEAINAYREADRRAPQENAAPSPTASPGCSRRRGTTSPHVASSTAPAAHMPPIRHT